VIAGGTMALGTGANGDGVRLRDCTGAIVDTVVYGDADNAQAVIDDSGAAATSVAPKPGRDESVARRFNGVDTDLSGDDFWVLTSPTPGGSNPAPPVCTQSNGNDIKINELLANPAGADGTALAEYVELYNRSGATMPLEGWKIEIRTSASGGWSTKATLPASASASPGDFYLVGEANVPGADFVPADLLSLGSGAGGDGVRLVDCAGNVVDTVVYGDTNEDGILDDRGATDSFAGKPGDDEAIARIEDGVDTDRSGVDFFLTDVRTPGARNPGAPACETGGRVVINEFVANPAGADGDVLLEWVELYNADDEPALLEGWTLRLASSGDSYSVKHTFAAGVVVPADGHLLVGEANVPGADVVLPGVLGLGSGLRADGVRLVDCASATVDTVVFGDASNEDAVTDDLGVATSVAPTPGDDVALARRRDGQDTNRSGDDFVASSSPTPGAPNPTFECFPSDGDVLINEFLPDPGGSDGEVMLEWLELYNRSGDPLRVDGWVLVFASDEEDVAPDVLMPPESVVPALGFLVVGAANVESADVIAPMSLGNGSGGDAVRLIDCEGTVVDIVVYGDENEDGLLDESGNLATSARKPGSDESLARVEDGADTDQHTDWQVDRSPSPGEPNAAPVDTSDPPDDERRGCQRRDAPGTGAPEGGCNSEAPPSAERGCVTVWPLGGLEVLLAGAVALTRRRRRS
jgi:hypothetical protein